MSEGMRVPSFPEKLSQPSEGEHLAFLRKDSLAWRVWGRGKTREERMGGRDKPPILSLPNTHSWGQRGGRDKLPRELGMEGMCGGAGREGSEGRGGRGGRGGGEERGG